MIAAMIITAWSAICLILIVGWRQHCEIVREHDRAQLHDGAAMRDHDTEGDAA